MRCSAWMHWARGATSAKRTWRGPGLEPSPVRARRLPGRSSTLYWLCSRFFFQAEDGIRDLTVTRVQTCALPISMRWWCQPVLGYELVLARRCLGAKLLGRCARSDCPSEQPGDVRESLTLCDIAGRG